MGGGQAGPHLKHSTVCLDLVGTGFVLSFHCLRLEVLCWERGVDSRENVSAMGLRSVSALRTPVQLGSLARCGRGAGRTGPRHPPCPHVSQDLLPASDCAERFPLRPPPSPLAVSPSWKLLPPSHSPSHPCPLCLENMPPGQGLTRLPTAGPRSGRLSCYRQLACWV